MNQRTIYSLFRPITFFLYHMCTIYKNEKYNDKKRNRLNTQAQSRVYKLNNCGLWTNKISFEI